MVDTACRALYDTVFHDGVAFVDALFKCYFPHCVRVKDLDGEPVSMLFSIPAILMAGGARREARYLFAVATRPDQRTRGFAGDLLAAERARGIPLFLHPASASLFDYYGAWGFTPFGGFAEWEGESVPARDGDGWRVVALDAYVTARRRFLKEPFLEMDATFLSLSDAGALVGEGGAAYFERDGDTVLFREWLGSRDAAARAAGFLGAARYEARTPDANGTPFAMGYGIPADTVFLTAMD